MMPWGLAQHVRDVGESAAVITPDASMRENASASTTTARCLFGARPALWARARLCSTLSPKSPGAVPNGFES
ncbi:hypothetical protein CR51_09260 [Caballeronia megalochromosomata]|nr:hypothetical protein CR51_09260 [Caballeronia megalochromosomata]